MNKTNTGTTCEYCGKRTTEQHYGVYCCIHCYNDIERENAYTILADIGVPFPPMANPSAFKMVRN